MNTFDRINELKKLKSIEEDTDIEKDELFLQDESSKYYIEYIIENKIPIHNKQFNQFLSNYPWILDKMIKNDYYLDNYYNVDLLFDTAEGQPLIEKMYEKDPKKVCNLSLDIIYRLFSKVNDDYMIEKLLHIDENNCISIIKRVHDGLVLYNCFKDINRLDLMKFANEACWLTKINGMTILEELINNQVDIKDNVFDKSKAIADILYKKQQYMPLLQMDAEILVNNNYLNLLIIKYKNGEDIPFKKANFKSANNKSLAETYLILLQNNIILNNYNLVEIKSNNNLKPVIIHMLEIDKTTTLKYFNNPEVKQELTKYFRVKLNINIKLDFSILDVFKYTTRTNKLLLKLQKKKKIEKSDIFDEDFLEINIYHKYTLLEYTHWRGIEIYKSSPTNIQEAMIFIKLKKEIPYINEKLLYEGIGNNKKLIDLLIENNYYECIKASVKDLRIMDYCLKYDNFEIIGDNIIEELFVNINGQFKGEIYLNNEKFVKRVINYGLSDDKLIQLYQKGYKSLIADATDEILLAPYKGGTILDDMLNSRIEPLFKNNFIESLETLKILEKHNRYDLFYNAKLELLINYPNPDNNYLLRLIELYKQGVDVHFEKISYKIKNKDIMSKVYIVMEKNGMGGFLNKLEEKDLLEKRDGENLLYYLIKNDTYTTICQILNGELRQNTRINAELKLLGVSAFSLSLSEVAYNPYEIDDIYRQTYNKEYYTEEPSLLNNFLKNFTILSPSDRLLEKLKKVFIKSGSNIDIVDAVITSYRYLISIDSMFIEEVKLLIQIKEEQPNFNFLKELGSGFFDPGRGVVVENSTISHLNHEIGHALHYYLTNFEVPSNFDDVIYKIVNNPKFITKVDEFAKTYKKISNETYEKAEQIVNKHMKEIELNIEEIQKLLNEQKEDVIKYYMDRGYTRETLEIVLFETFTIEDFLKQKREVQIGEVDDLIMRYYYDSFIAICDIIDAITDGKYRSRLLKNQNNEIIPPSYGHGIRYYLSNDNPNCWEFTEMIANYSSIIKSKKKDEALLLLRSIVGDELVDLLDVFYKNKMLKMEETKKMGRLI